MVQKTAKAVAGEPERGESNAVTAKPKETAKNRVEESIDPRDNAEILEGRHSTVSNALQTLLRQQHRTYESMLDIRDARLGPRDGDPFTHGENDE